MTAHTRATAAGTGTVGAAVPLLAADGLTVHRVHDEATVVPPVDLSVGDGEVLAVVGASGAGKTTLLRTLFDVLPDGLRRTGGTVSWRGTTVPAGRAARRWRRAHCGWLGQDPGAALNPLWRVDRLIGEEFTGDAATRAERVGTLMDRLGLTPGLASRRAGELSGGQAQRVALARALCTDPDLLVLDEPTSALDAACADMVAEAVRSLRGSSGRGVVLVTHDARLAAELADRTLVLEPVAASGPARTPSRPGSRARRTPNPAPAIAGADENSRPATDVPVPGAGHSSAFPPRHEAGLASVHASQDTTLPPAPGRCRTTAASGPVLSARGLELRTPDGTPLLDRCDLELTAGDWLAVTGASGAGKTTLLHALAGRRPPAGGQVLLHGRPLPATARLRDRETLRAIQLAGQDPATELNPAHSVGRSVARPLRVFHGVGGPAGRKRARELLAAVGLPAELAGRGPSALSGGQRRRAVLARALAARPDVLLLDEPTAALDPVSARSVLDLVEQLRRDGLAVLTVTHDPDTAARADRVLHLAGRRLTPRPPTTADHRHDTSHDALHTEHDERTEHPGVRPHRG
ncbi:ABC transporter ATP-binding protein [Streptomyces minutiscleroticus]|uniref:ABC transporter ATP-binding protein n=1 Tax=Streptomyces minutiscleroticus TaxID=68238 RepID=A0A918NN28_9ACTN|nr:ATP-binding cassette domain-containing protein [Streptomyces minutiscleroticus]GGX81505.1 ABC transporter ATP-binding protein [Streptomyces minutiscleroticus]